MTTPRLSGQVDVNAAGRRSIISRLSAVVCVVALAPALMTGQAQALLGPDASADRAKQQTIPPGPPPVRVFTNSVLLRLNPYTSCWSSGNVGMCYDGMPPRPRPSVGGTEGPIRLAFAADGWRFQVSVINEDGHRKRVDVVRTGPHHWRLALGALADGHYRADVFGRGPQGDVVVTFAFTLN